MLLQTCSHAITSDEEDGEVTAIIGRNNESMALTINTLLQFSYPPILQSSSLDLSQSDSERIILGRELMGGTRYVRSVIAMASQFFPMEVQFFDVVTLHLRHSRQAGRLAARRRLCMCHDRRCSHLLDVSAYAALASYRSSYLDRNSSVQEPYYD